MYILLCRNRAKHIDSYSFINEDMWLIFSILLFNFFWIKIKVEKESTSSKMTL